MYVRDAESGLWPPTPHVKYIPGGHPHLPQIIIIISIIIIIIIIVIIILIVFCIFSTTIT